MKNILHRRVFRAVLSLAMMVVVIAAAFPLTMTTGVTTARAESRATNWLQNGSFESGLTNWTVVGTVIDLGVTSLGGCVSVDTTDYSTFAGGQTSDITAGSHSSFTATVETSGGIGYPAEGTKYVYLNLGGGSATPNYHIKHGPAIVSDAFKAVAGQDITLNWYSAAGSDDFAVIGYLLNTDANGNGTPDGSAGDCSQTEVLDVHGSNVTGWQYDSVTVPTTGDFYKFVFVNGTHDLSGGGASGASFWIDNISQGDPQTITMNLSSVAANKHATWTTSPFSIASYATTTSGLAATFVSTTTGVCTISGSTITLVTSGTCTIRASQAGGTDGSGTLWASAPSVTSSFTVTNIAATAQTITFAALTAKETTAADFTVSATTTSPLTVTYRVTPSTSSGICTVTTTGEVDVTGAGLCSIDAVQAGGVSGGTTYAPATTVTRTFNVLTSTAQTITFAAISDRLSTAGTFSVSPTALSGLAVTVTSQTTSVCTISSGTVTTLIPGTCTLRATQAGGDVGFIRYTAAPDVDVSFNVQDTQTITFNALTEKLTTAANFTVSATSDSSLTVTYRVTPSTSAGICTVTTTGEVAVIGPGVCSIDALQVGGTSGGISYVAGTPVTRTFNVMAPTAQTITFAGITDRLSTAGTFSVSPTASSGLAVTVTSQTTSVCTISSGTVSLVTDGTCTLRAVQAGGDDGFIRYTAAPNVEQSFTVLATQTISFGSLGEKFTSDANFTVTGTASSGLPLTFSTTSATSICTVTPSGVVDVVGPGTCSITANQVGGLESGSGKTYGAAPPVTRTFMVNAVQTITFNPTDKVYTVADYNLTATIAPATGLALTYSTSISSAGVCTVSPSGSVNLLDVGVCTVTVTAAGGTFGGVTYGPATVTKSFNATGAVQTISFPTLPEWRLYEGDEITPGAATNSGLPVTYTAGPPEVCEIVGGKIKVVGLRKCTVTASAAAGTSTSGTKFGAAANVVRAFFITDTKPTATFTPTNTRTPTPTQTPTPIPFLLKKGAVGASFVLGLLQNDTLVTWGMGREGQASIAPCCNSAIQDIAVGTNFALVLKGGRVFGWGANTKGQMNFPTSTKSGIKAVAAGGAHGLALTTAGNVIAWGDNLYGQAKSPALKKVVTSVVGGANHTVVLYADGTVGAWGQNTSKQASPPATLKGITQIAAGLDHNLALTDKDTVLAWGGNSHLQSKIPTNVIDIKQVSAGTQFSMAVKKNGEVIAWGRNDYGQTKIPPLTNIYSAFAGYANTILGLRNGRIVVLGDQTNGVAVSRTPTPTP